MKKLCILVLCLCVLGVTGVFARQMESVVVDVTTGPAVGDAYQPIGNFLNLIIGSDTPKSLISRITLTSDDSTVAQTVTLWEGWTDGTSTAAVRKIWEWDLDAYSSSETVTIQETFHDGDRCFLKSEDGLAATKTDSSAGITLSIQYK